MSTSFAPLRDRAFRTYFIGRAFSMLGSSMVSVALAFAVLDLTGSASDLGIVLAANSIPLVLFMLVGGVIADRFSRSRVLVVSHAGSAVTQAAVATLLITGHASIPALVVLEAANGTLMAFTFPALQGVVPMVVQRSHLQQANALLALVRNGIVIVGPSIAGVLVVTVGAGWAIAYDAGAYIIAAYCVSRLRLPASSRVEWSSMLTDLRVGWSEFVGRTWVWVVVLAFGALNAIHAGVLFTLGPAIAVDTIGRSEWGFVLSAEAVGFLVMTLILLRVTLRFPLRAGMLGIAALGGPMLLLGLDPQLLPLVTLAFLAGMGEEIFGIGWQTALQEQIPIDVLSRVASYDALGSFVAIPVGQLLAGPLAAYFGARDVAVGGAALYVGIAVLTLTSRSVRTLERNRETIPAGEAHTNPP